MDAEVATMSIRWHLVATPNQPTFLRGLASNELGRDQGEGLSRSHAEKEVWTFTHGMLLPRVPGQCILRLS